VHDVESDGFTLVFANPTGANLAGQFDGFVLSVEPEDDDDPVISGQIAYQGQIPEETLARVRLLDDVSRGQPLVSALVDGLPQQAQTYDSHQGFALEGIGEGNLAGAKQHSEHVINTIEGREGADYADWDGNGRIENPGDDVGLLPYLLILSDAIESGVATPEAETEAISVDVADLIVSVEDARDLARRVSSADTIEEIEPLVAEIEAVQVQIEQSVGELVQNAQVLELAIGAEVFAVGP
jgi:hypothetical protein